MFRIEDDVVVTLRPTDVWGLICDPTRAPEWNPAVVAAVPFDQSPLGQGKTWQLRMRGGGTMAFRIARFDPPRNLVLEGRGLGMLVIDDVRIERHANGTRVHWITTARLRGPLRLVELLARPLLARHLSRSLSGLRRWLEDRNPRSALFRRGGPTPEARP